ncbi:MAG TPA: hypothetical protein VLB83_03665, partial [Candidatus Paceibacterota bacterium]|nr:hypothetical protein [Candidatus Paceibacterota bacterium]
ETGNAQFDFTKEGNADPRTLPGWIRIERGPIHVKKDTTAEIPFSIVVPEDAEPGGHYAAIMVGTDPIDRLRNGSGFAIGSLLSSLLFVSVSGNIVEAGAIRDFYPASSIVQDPSARFVMRFENSGNVHLIPQGHIIITNMWGKERGRITVNDDASFGSVLPASTRRFEFEWHGEKNFFEMGRYTVEATLAYGGATKQSVYRVATFWVVPYKELAIAFASLGAFLFVIVYGIRRYVRSVVALERARLGVRAPKSGVRTEERSTPRPVLTLSALARPMTEGGAELRTIRRKGGAGHRKAVLRKYRFFFVFLLTLGLGAAMIGWYFVEVMRAERSYEMVIKRDGGKDLRIEHALQSATGTPKEAE